VAARDFASVASVPTNKAFETPSALQPASV
jgi:hypothetical protein